MPKVSVIIPIYGVEEYIEKCALSLFRQTLDDIEYLFIDDCSPDNSISILKSIIELFPNRKSQVTIHRMPQNSGQAAARKWGMQHATGDYIIHCDSDDWIEHEMYSSMYEKAQSENLDVVLCDYYVIGNGHVTYKPGLRKRRGVNDIISDILTVKTASSVCNKLFRRSIFADCEPEFPTHNMGEDMVLCISGLVRCKSFGYIQKPFYNYLTRQNSIVHNPQKVLSNYNDTIANIERIEDIINRHAKGTFKWQLITLKVIKRERVAPTFSNKEYKELWKNTYKEIGYKYLLSPYLPLKRKIKNLLLSFI